MPWWPTKAEREAEELDYFIRDYKKLPWGRKLETVERRERPDFVLGDEAGMLYGVEITSAYVSDRTVPDFYKEIRGKARLPRYTGNDVATFEEIILARVAEKVDLARSGYECLPEMILGVHIADPIAHRIAHESWWQELYDRNQARLKNIEPFTEVAFFNLANYQIFAIRAGRHAFGR